MSKHKFFSDCVSWPGRLVDCPGGLSDCISEEEEISIERLLEEVDTEHLVRATHLLGYTGPTPDYNNPEHPQHQPREMPFSMKEDWHVRCYKSEFLGRQVFYFTHSGIEHVYIPVDWNPSEADIDWGDDEEADLCFTDGADEEVERAPTFSI